MRRLSKFGNPISDCIVFVFHQQLNRFEGFAHGKMYVFSSIIFTEVNCVPSKLNYFVHKEQSIISSNHFDRYLEGVKEGCGDLKTVESSVFAREAFKPMY